jgi:hypothetical protein
MAVEILNVRIAAERELVLAKAKSFQQSPVVKDFRAFKIGDRDIDVVDANSFGHGGMLRVEETRIKVAAQLDKLAHT